MKKFILYFLCSCLFCTTTITIHAEFLPIEGTDLLWRFDQGTLSIRGDGQMPNYQLSGMPWANYRPVVSSVIIGDSVTNIGTYAFVDFQEIKSVFIGKNVISIGDGAFGNCIGLTEIYNYAFYPQYIDCYVFFCWDGLDPENVTLYVPAASINSYREADIWSEFENIEMIANSDGDCELRTEGKITWVICEGTLTISGDGDIPDYGVDIQPPWSLFKESIVAIEIQKGVSRIGNRAFENCNNLTSVDISNSVLSVGEWAFVNCLGLKSITIGESVETIGAFAFNFCFNLKSVIFPRSVTSIGAFAFQSCYNITEVFNYAVVPQPINYNDNVFTLGQSNIMLYVPVCSEALYREAEVWKDYDIIPMESDDCVTEFADGVFFYRIIEGTTNVKVGWNYWSEEDCLENLVIPSHVTYKEVEYTVTEIEEESFSGCWETLISLTIPETVIKIGDYAFSSCSKLISITVYWAEPIRISEFVFQDVEIEKIQLFVPQGSKAAYSAANVWKEFKITDFTEIVEHVYFLEIIDGEIYVAVDMSKDIPQGGKIEWRQEPDLSQNGNVFLFKFSGLESNDNNIRTLSCIVYDANGIVAARYVVNVQSSRIRISIDPAVTEAKVSLYVKIRKDDVDLLEVIPKLNGMYVSDELPKGEYIVSVESQGYLFTYYNMDGNVIVNWTDPDITWISLEGGIDEMITVKLKEEVKLIGNITISGKLVDVSILKASAVPIAKSTVVLSSGSAVKSTDNIEWTVIATTAPDENGNYLFTGLPPGLYRITVEIAGYELEGEIVVDATELEGNVNEEIVDQNFMVDEETKTISVATYAVTSVSLNKTTLTFFIGDKEELIATIEPDNATNKEVMWSSNNTAVATVNDDGLVTAKTVGTATITVKTQDGNHTDQCTVMVQNKQVTGFEISEALPVQVYPNPTDGMVALEFDAVDVYRITLADMNGKIILRQSVNDWIIRIDISSYPAGVYLLIIDDGKQQKATRLIKN